MKTQVSFRKSLMSLASALLIAILATSAVSFFVFPATAACEDQVTTVGDNYDPEWSPDGKRLAFRSIQNGSWNIWTMNTDGSGGLQISNMPSQRAAWGPTYQPNNDRIYYIDNSLSGADYWWVIRTSLDGSAGRNQVMLVPGGEPFTPPSFSEDGTRFCYVHASYNEDGVREARREIKIANADGSNVRTVLRDDALRHYTGIVWGKGTSNNKMAYSKADTGIQCIFTIDTDGSNVTRITEPSLGNCEVTDFVSDKIFFTNNNQVSYVNVQTKKITRITDDAYENSQAVLSPDGKKIAYTSKRDGVCHIYITPEPASSCEEFQLTRTANNSGPAWSSDGSKLAFIKWDDRTQNLWTIHSDGSDEKVLTSYSNNRGGWYIGVWGAAFRPNTSQIYYMEDSRGTLHWIRWASEDGNSWDNGVGYVPGGDGFSPPSFSEDGSQRCYIHYSYNESGARFARREIKIANTDGSNVRIILRDDDMTGNALWGKGTSNNKIAYSKTVSGVSCIFTIDTDGSNVTQISDPSLGDCEVTDFVSDKIFFTNNNQVSYVNVQTKKITRITDDAYENSQAVLSPDGKKIAYTSKRDGVCHIYITCDPDSEMPSRADVWVADPAPDAGVEPNTVSQNIWTSPDVWVRNQNDGGLSYQKVRYGQDNYVYVRVRNKGSLTAKNTTVDVHRINASLGSGWPKGWSPVGKTVIPELEAGKETIVSILWEKGSIPNPGHYCFYVRLLNDSDPIAFPEISNALENARKNNNIAWRNFDVVGLLNKVTEKFQVNVVNFKTEKASVDLVFDEKENLVTPEGAKAAVDLGAVFESWKAAGAEGENIRLLGGTEVQLLGTPAKIIGIPMNPEETQPVTMRVDAFKPMPGSGTSREYRFSVSQFIDSELAGGMDYTIVTRAQDTDSDNDLIKDVADDDNDNDEIPDTWEIEHGLNPLDPSDALEDDDYDDLTNLEEYKAGTDPNDPASKPCVEFQLTKTDFVEIDPTIMPECEFGASPAPETVPLKDGNGLWNLALLKTAKPNASSLIEDYPLRHSVERLTDGWYNNCRSWVAAEMPAWSETDLGDEYLIQKVVFGSEHTAMFNDRAATTFSILVATAYDAASSSPTWKEVFRYDGSPVQATTVFSFEPVKARFVRIHIEKSVGSEVRIDELEIYGSEISSCISDPELTDPDCTQWNLSEDFRSYPDQENPNRDSCGNPGVWHFMQSTTLERNPANYSLIQGYVNENGIAFLGKPDIYNWAGSHNSFPIFWKNNSSATIQNINGDGVALIPSNTFVLHPATDGLAVVGWRSPIDGTVSIIGSVSKLHYGNTAWSLDKGSVCLASGNFDNVNQQSFQVANVAVNKGDFIYFTLDPRGDYYGDSTLLDITIAATSEPVFKSGVFTVGSNGVVQFDWLYDGGMYKGELGIFSLKGMETLAPGSTEFIAEAVRRVLSDSTEGHIVLSDPAEGARFSGSLGEATNWNSGEYKGVKSFEMMPGDSFVTILVPDSTFTALAANPGTADSHKRPLFSLVSPNPAYGMYLGQIADVNGMGTAFSYEDMSADTSDRDYNDLIIQVFGAAVRDIPSMDSLKGKTARSKRDSSDWRTGTELGRIIMAHLDAQAVSPETVWLSADVNFPADITVYSPDETAFGTKGGHIPGATFGTDIDGYLFVKLPSIENGGYRIVLLSAEEQSGLLTLRKHQGDEILSENGETVTVKAHGTVKAEVSVSDSGDESGVEIGTAEECLRYDINGDGVIDDVDIESVTGPWNTCKGNEKFDPFFDLDDDGCITVKDIMMVAGSGGNRQ